MVVADPRRRTEGMVNPLQRLLNLEVVPVINIDGFGVFAQIPVL